MDIGALYPRHAYICGEEHLVQGVDCMGSSSYSSLFDSVAAALNAEELHPHKPSALVLTGILEEDVVAHVMVA